MKLNKPLTKDTMKAAKAKSPEPPKKKKSKKKKSQVIKGGYKGSASLPSLKVKRPKKEASPLKKEYMKERRRVQNAISRMKKAGYDVSGIEVPKIPQRITPGSVSRLKKQFSTKKLYEKATYTTPEGEVISGTRAKVRIARGKREAKKEKTAPLPKTAPIETEESFLSEADVIIENFRAEATEILHPHSREWMEQKADSAEAEFNSFLDSMITEHGKEKVAMDIKEKVDWGALVDNIKFDSLPPMKGYEIMPGFFTQLRAIFGAEETDKLQQIVDFESDEFVEVDEEGLISEFMFL